METGSFKPVRNKALKIAGLIIVQALVSADAISASLGKPSILGGFFFGGLIIAGLIFASVLALIDSWRMSLLYILAAVTWAGALVYYFGW